MRHTFEGMDFIPVHCKSSGYFNFNVRTIQTGEEEQGYDNICMLALYIFHEQHHDKQLLDHHVLQHNPQLHEGTCIGASDTAPT